MMEKLMTMLVGILLALMFVNGWSLSRTFELSTSQAVLLDKVERLEMQSRLLEEKLSKWLKLTKNYRTT